MVKWTGEIGDVFKFMLEAAISYGSVNGYSHIPPDRRISVINTTSSYLLAYNIILKSGR